MANVISRVIVVGLLLIGGLFSYKLVKDGSAESQLDAARRQTEARLQAEIAAEKQRSEKLQREKEALQLKNDALAAVVKRLQTDRRVARLVVMNQQTPEIGPARTTLLFTEYARDGKTLLKNAREFTVDGVGVHIDAYVIQFAGKYVEENDPLKGHSVAMFHRIFGDNQTPADAFVLDSPGDVPDVYKGEGVDPRLADAEKELWKDFWKLAADRTYREKLGVKLAYGSSSFHQELKKGTVYTLTLDPQGGLKMSSD
jgi:hypothetical protein